MGLVGFLDFVLKCIQILAWPSFALGYPLCASIRAIETNSNFHMRKLVAYWICFSLISLFENTFSKLLEWVSVWPFVKILAVCWLVIPYFNGASIAYNTIVRPCLSMQLIASKPIINEPPVSQKDIKAAQKDIKAEEIQDKSVAATDNNEPPVSQKDIKAAQKDIKAEEIQDKSVAATDNKITRVEADIKDKNMTLPEKLTENAVQVLPAFKNVQKEWTCAACQVTTQSEATLKQHLHGMKHRTKQEELKAGKQTAAKKGVSTGTPNKERNCTISQVTTQSETTWTSLHQEFIAVKQTANKNNSSSTRIKSEQPNQYMKKVSSGSGINKVSSANEDPKKSSSGSGPNKFGCDICQLKLQSEATLKSHLQGTKHKAKSEQLKASKVTENDKITSSTKYSDKNTSELNKNPSAIVQVTIKANTSNRLHSCSICNVTCTRESDMASHLCGKRHLSEIEDLNHARGVHYWCNLCDVKCKSEIDMASHLNGKTHDSNLNIAVVKIAF